MYPVRIEGQRIFLRDFELNDLDSSMAIVGDSSVTDFLSFDIRTREEQAQRLAADVERAQANPRPDYYLAVVARDTQTLIGFARIGLSEDQPGDTQRSGELGAAMRHDRWRQGYGAEAAVLMLNFAFETLGLHRVQAACGPYNAASQRALEKLGFQYEARIRDHVFTNGAWRDSLLYAVLAADWRTHRAKLAARSN